ncbi:unnamed protein product [Amaranthus hypochondriacus]
MEVLIEPSHSDHVFEDGDIGIQSQFRVKNTSNDLVVDSFGGNLCVNADQTPWLAECDGNNFSSSNFLVVSETVENDEVEKNAIVKEAVPCVENEVKMLHKDDGLMPSLELGNMIAELHDSASDGPAPSGKMSRVPKPIADQTLDPLVFDPIVANTERLGTAGDLVPRFDPLVSTCMNSWVSNTSQTCSHDSPMPKKVDSSKGLVAGCSMKRPRGRPKKITVPIPTTQPDTPPLSKSAIEAQDTWNMAKLLGISSRDENAMIESLRKAERLRILDETRP